MIQTAVLVTAILIEIALFFFLAVIAYLMIEGVRTVPWVRTRSAISKAMLEFAHYQAHERVLDLGSGDGSIVFAAVKQGGGGVGIERIGLLVAYARLRARVRRCTSRAQFQKANLYTCTFPKVQVITSYLFPEVNKRVEPRLKEAFPKGTRVVSRDFKFPTLRLVKQERCKGSYLFLYEI
jgi:hypothetical protein